jgi:hypothetical protein
MNNRSRQPVLADGSIADVDASPPRPRPPPLDETHTCSARLTPTDPRALGVVRDERLAIEGRLLGRCVLWLLVDGCATRLLELTGTDLPTGSDVLLLDDHRPTVIGI